MEKWLGLWKVKFGQWDNILHSFLCALKNAREEATESKIPFGQALVTELNCDADLRAKVTAWPKLALKIVKYSIPPKAKGLAKKFVLSVSK